MKATLLALLVLALACGAQASSSQSFVVVGDDAIEASLASSSLEAPVLLETAGAADADSELAELVNPFLSKENELIAANEATLSSVELLAHQMGAPVYSELVAEKSEHDVEMVEHSLLSHEAHAHSNVELLGDDAHLPTALLEQAPVAAPKAHSEIESMEAELNMVELGSEVSRPATKLSPKNDYAFLDDPLHGGQPTVLKNLKGLDIYVVNTPVLDNDNEIRPVKPPHPMSAAMREKARLAALMRKQLIHDIPQPKAAIKPKTAINTLSAYESSLTVSRPIKKLRGRALRNPIVGGQGAIQLKGVAAKARFQQMENGQEITLPGTGATPSLPVFPKDPTASPTPIRAFGAGSSFDNRDGPPALLDDLLPIKAVLVEDLDPLGIQAGKKASKPNW
jgi:hypothetical protein